MDKIFIKGARENNLKNIDVEIPRDKLVVFTGLSGSGKTTIGTLLTELLPDYKFIDTDKIIVKLERRSINDIFAIDGEGYFRDLETKVANGVSTSENQVISTGGGIILRQENMDALRSNGVIFYLKTSPETLIKRLEGDSSRPLLKTDDVKAKLEKMLEIRGKLYEKADITVETDNLSAEETAKEIVRLFNENC